jgi:hypothetical protein
VGVGRRLPDNLVSGWTPLTNFSNGSRWNTFDDILKIIRGCANFEHEFVKLIESIDGELARII